MTACVTFNDRRGAARRGASGGGGGRRGGGWVRGTGTPRAATPLKAPLSMSGEQDADAHAPSTIAPFRFRIRATNSTDSNNKTIV